MDTAGVNVNKNEIKSPCTAQREVVKIQREGARRAGGRPREYAPHAQAPGNNRRVADSDYTGPMRGRGPGNGMGWEGERTV